MKTDVARIRIGEWWVDPATNELSRAGETRRIEPKAMDVLMLLAGRPGQVASREELFEAVWPGVIVGEEALTQSIIKLRRALADSPRSPSYIETISKRGYRLIAPVQRGAAVEAIPATDEPDDLPREPRTPRRARARSPLWIAGLVVAVIAAGIHFFLVRPGPPEAPQAADARDAGLVTMTVLPFESSGAGEEQAYFARGISEDLMTDLSRLSGWRLIRPSGAASPPPPNARYLVSGGVQRQSDTLRIGIRLIDTKTNEQLWSERFERPFGDLFALQDEMSRRLVEVLPGKVSDAERQRLAKRYTRSLEAYDYFLRAQALFLVRGPAANEDARELYRKALEADPAFARAYAGIAMTHAMDYRLRPSTDSRRALERAFGLAETARQIDPDIPEIHWALGFIHAQGRRHDEALKALQKAIDLNRSFADAYALMAGIHTYMGQPAKSIPLLRTAMRLKPDGGYLYYLVLGRAYLFENDFEQSIINLREALARNPVDLEARVLLAAALVAAGDPAGAEWEAEEIRALEAGFSARAWLDTYPMTSAPQNESLLQLLAKVKL